jgi:pyridoxine 4-dehydrogenase
MNATAFLGDKPVNRMGYGAMQLAGPGVFGLPDDPEGSRAVLRRPIERGVDHIDTSQYYGPDVVNDLIRQALYPYPDNLRLVTKVGARRDAAGRVLPAQRPDELSKGVEANLHTLRVERLDLVNLRLVETARDDAVPLEEQLLALQFVDVAEIQNGYSIIDRRDEDTLEFARERGMAPGSLRPAAAHSGHELDRAP